MRATFFSSVLMLLVNSFPDMALTASVDIDHKRTHVSGGQAVRLASRVNTSIFHVLIECDAVYQSRLRVACSHILPPVAFGIDL